MDQTVSVFISYSHEDDELRRKLRTQLKGVGNIDVWDDRQISAGTVWSDEIGQAMDAADIILLLVSSDFIASDFVREHEIPNALTRHQAGTARVIPVLLRHCEWKGDHIGIKGLQAFPPDEKWVTSTTDWGSTDAALLSVVKGVQRVVEDLADQARQRAEERTKRLEAYRRSVADALSDGHISKAEQRTLDDEREHLGLTEAEAAEVLAGEIQPIEEKKRNIEKYRESVDDYVEEQRGEALTEEQHVELRKRQAYLGLTDDDVAGVEAEQISAWVGENRDASAESPTDVPADVQPPADPSDEQPPGDRSDEQAPADPSDAQPPADTSDDQQPTDQPAPAAEPATPAASAPAPETSHDAPDPKLTIVLDEIREEDADLGERVLEIVRSDSHVAETIVVLFDESPRAARELAMMAGLAALERDEVATELFGPDPDRWSRALLEYLLTFPYDKHKLNIYVAPNIPDKRLRNGQQRSEFPADEQVVALFDTNAMSSGKNSMIFGRRGVHFNHNSEARSMSYDALSSAEQTGTYAVSFGDLSWETYNPDEFVEFFNGLRDLADREYAPA